MSPYVKFCLFCNENVGEGEETKEMIVCPICGAFLPAWDPELRSEYWPINSLYREKGYILMSSLHGGPIYNYYTAFAPKGSGCEEVIMKEFFPINAGYYREPDSDVVKKRNGFSQEEKLYRTVLENELAQLPSDFIPHEIRHPHMENVIDFFDANNTTYLVINRLDGCPLKQRTLLRTYVGGRFEYDSHRQSFEILLPMMLPLCRELASYHERGALHNNIKPETLLTDRAFYNWETKPICLRKEIPGVNNFDPLKSTPSTLSPHPTPWRAIETYSTKGNGPWTDIYALCASLYYCITCAEPPLAPNRLKNDPLRSPSQLGVNLPHHQEQALLKGLAVQPSDRWQSMDEFCDTLYGSQWKVQP